MASAGNNGLNTDTTAHVPSSLTTPNIIAVGALNPDGTYWAGSNYGVKNVDVAAPGVQVSSRHLHVLIGPKRQSDKSLLLRHASEGNHTPPASE